MAVHYFDRNGDGTINNQEWDAWVAAGSLVQKNPLNLNQDVEFAFTIADTNRDNYLNAQEIRDFIYTFGGQDIPLNQVEMAVHYFDADHDGVINRSEWQTWNAAGSLAQNPTSLSQDTDFAFMLADTNGDGFLDAQEIRGFVWNYGGQDVPLDQMQMAVHYFDADHDGVINKAEWETWNNAGSLAQKPSVANLLKK